MPTSGVTRGRPGPARRRPAAQQGELGGEQVEGRHAVQELVEVGRRHTNLVWVAEGLLGSPQLARIVGAARRRGAQVVPKAPEAMAGAARTGAHQGVIAWAGPVVAIPLDEVLASAEEAVAPLVLVLDGVTDPGNFGALLRSAACAGATAVLTARHRAAPLTPAAVKAAAGAVEHLAICVVPGVASALQSLVRSGFWVVGLDPDGADDLWSTPLIDGPVALVLGSEGSGLAQLVRQRCDAVVRIPQAGPLGSLNVATAGAVACFEVLRRRSGAALARQPGQGAATASSEQTAAPWSHEEDRYHGGLQRGARSYGPAPGQ